jgi:CRISPR/Cas system CSM-associated protein Csm3 (group 7 of RAMP superfamily)
MFIQDRVSFLPRYRVKGTLTLTAPLHIGDGRTSEKRGVFQKKKEDNSEKPVKVNTVQVDVNEQAIIPGSTIKGDLAAGLRARGFTGAGLGAIFGAVDNGDPVRGGKVEFRDARLTGKAPPMSGANETTRRYWCSARGTCVEPHVVIDPRTRTADDHLLFHLEFVPEGSQFEVVLEGLQMSPEELLFLIRALELFNEGVRLGAKSSNGWGSANWTLGSVEFTPEQKMREWLAAPEFDLPYEAYRDDPAKLTAQAHQRYAPSTERARCRFEIELHFNGAFLINDPSQRRTGGDDPLSFATVLTRDGGPYLPASSLRGALRGQAARIWRTLATDQAAAHPQDQLAEAKRSGDQKSLQPFLKLFGSPGWLAPIEISDFTFVRGVEHRQEFVAIDRFTGGASEGAKFNALGLYAPAFRGTIQVDTERLGDALNNDDQLWPWLLLAFVLRDLAEGDISIGFGAGKGYGHVADAVVTPNALPDRVAPLFAEFPFGKPIPKTVQDTVDAAHEELLCCVSQAELPAHVETNRRGG